MVSEPAARMLNPAAFAGETFLPCLGGSPCAAPCGVAGITYIGGCEAPDRGAATAAAGVGGEPGMVSGVGEEPGIVGMVRWLPFLRNFGMLISFSGIGPEKRLFSISLQILVNHERIR